MLYRFRREQQDAAKGPRMTKERFEELKAMFPDG